MLAEESWCWLAFASDDQGVVPPNRVCLLVSYSRWLQGLFLQSSSLYAWWNWFERYKYFARVVLYLCVNLHKRKPGQRLLKPLCCSTQPKTCVAH